MFEPASKSMPAIDYVSMVTSVYKDRRAMVMASVGCAIGAGASAYKTSSLLLWAVTAAFLVIAFFRYISMTRFLAEKVGPTDVEAAAKWEVRATYWASAIALNCGVWCVFSFLFVGDSFAQLISMTTTVACMVGVVTRNFGLVRMLNIQIGIAVALLAGSLLLKGDIYLMVLGLLLLP